MEVRDTFSNDDGPRNFSWVVPNELAAMGCPTSLMEIKELAARGVCHLVTLSEEAIPPGVTSKSSKVSHKVEEPSSSICHSPDSSRKSITPDRSLAELASSETDMFYVMLRHVGPLNWLFLPIEEYCAPTLRQVVRFIEFCINCRDRGEAVAIHCRGGRGRTGAMAACYLVYFEEMTPERAITTLRLARPGSIETYRQERIVYEFRDLIRLDSYENLVLTILREPHEELSLLQTEVDREREKKLRLNYFEREQIKKEMKVLDYNTLHCFRTILRKYIPFYPDLTPVY